jgi:hypothetical protein
MAKAVVIRVDFTDESDGQWIRDKVVPPVEDAVDELKESGRLDGEVEVTWEYED